MTWVRCRDQLGAQIFLELFEGGALEFKKIMRMSVRQLIESNNLVAGQYPHKLRFLRRRVHVPDTLQSTVFNNKNVITHFPKESVIGYLQSYKSYKEDLGYNIITILYLLVFTILTLLRDSYNSCQQYLAQLQLMLLFSFGLHRVSCDCRLFDSLV